MIMGKVFGTVISTSKNNQLIGYKFMLVQYIENDVLVDKFLVAVDGVGAGAGEKVLVATGSAARLALDNREAPVDATIVGIIDERQG